MSKTSLRKQWDAALYAEHTERTRSWLGPEHLEAAEFYAPARDGILRYAARHQIRNPYSFYGRRGNLKALELEDVHQSFGSTLRQVDWAVRFYAGRNPRGWASAEHFITDSRSRMYELGTDQVQTLVNPGGHQAHITTADVGYRLRQQYPYEDEGGVTEIDVVLDGRILPLVAMPLTMVRDHSDAIIGALHTASRNAPSLVKGQI